MKKATFVCQLIENSLKVIKYLPITSSERKFINLETETIPADIDDKNLAERINRLFKKLGYGNNPVVVSLPRSEVSCRYLKIPSQAPGEIEKIIGLQAPHYLPYPAEELIIGYQIISTDKEGYSDVNLIITHRNVIERYIKMFRALKTKRFVIVLSSYGICNFYSHINSQESATVMIVDADSHQAELAVSGRRKLLFSRSFKLNRLKTDWENLFIEEINKTRDAYLKEVSKEPPRKIIVLGTGTISAGLAERLSKNTGLPVEVLHYNEKINIPESLLNKMVNSDSSFLSLIGLGMEAVTGSLNLLPKDIKEQVRKTTHARERLGIILLISGIILIWTLGTTKNLDNKARYLERLKVELDKIAKEAGALEEIEKRFQILENQALKKSSGLDMLYELHKIMTDQVSLVSFSYEEDNQVILRGQTPQMSPVFALVSQLEKSPVFKDLNIKIRYATKKKTQTGEIVDFEIICLKNYSPSQK